ncbi:MAG: hypothetical protein QM537_04025 [Candidatus Symbiobacter sp.]|nr:hypothetical protein [Candidatus Symbiobacter sp.]
MSDAKQIRDAIIAAIPEDTSDYGQADQRRKPYFPPAHIKALSLSSNLVVGARGVGKSFWTHALADQNLKEVMGKGVDDLKVVDVKVGYSEDTKIESYPDKETIGKFIKNKIEPYYIWKAVIIRWLSQFVKEIEIPNSNWEETIKWVEDSPEDSAKLLQLANKFYLNKQRKGLIVFDALDRTSNNWDDMNVLVRDLLKLTLDLKPFSSLQAKVFLRPDQMDRVVTNFPDASKLFQTKTDLDWEAKDLHGLLWHTLCNAENSHGEIFRGIYHDVTKPNTEMSQIDGVWSLDDFVKRNDIHFKPLFEVLAGNRMGRDSRRGVPYIWTVGHLADGKRKTSPRSFLAAIRTAAIKTADDHPEHHLPLHFDAIKKGVQAASMIRIREMTEDYPWVDTVLRPLKGLNVPNEIEAFVEKWFDEFGKKFKSLEFFDNILPPPHIDKGWEGVLLDLNTLGIIEMTRDNRYNIPDLYRVGYGLGRLGGVKPVK